MEGKKLVRVIVISGLFVACAILIFQNINLRKQAQVASDILAQNAASHNILNFTRTFVSKVLGAKGEVGLDDRLQLETMVRGLNDKAVLAAWNAFVNSQTPAAAQQTVKDLLTLLIYKI